MLSLSRREIFLRYLRDRAEPSPERTRLLTAAYLLVGDEHDLREECEQAGFDESLLRDVLQSASPSEVAQLLFSCPVSPELFPEMFARTISQTRDYLTLSYLCDTARHFLRGHPGALSIPPEVIDVLRSAPDRSVRAVGLRVLVQIDAEDPRVIPTILEVIHGASGFEQLIGINATTEVFGLYYKQQRALPEAFVAQIVPRLADLKLSQDSSIRESAERVWGYFHEP